LRVDFPRLAKFYDFSGSASGGKKSLDIERAFSRGLPLRFELVRTRQALHYNTVQHPNIKTRRLNKAQVSVGDTY
jgi:hypothetical protein